MAAAEATLSDCIWPLPGIVTSSSQAARVAAARPVSSLTEDQR
jgi:hypothetical protein